MKKILKLTYRYSLQIPLTNMVYILSSQTKRQKIRLTTIIVMDHYLKYIQSMMHIVISNYILFLSPQYWCI